MALRDRAAEAVRTITELSDLLRVMQDLAQRMEGERDDLARRLAKSEALLAIAQSRAEMAEGQLDDLNTALQIGTADERAERAEERERARLGLPRAVRP